MISVWKFGGVRITGRGEQITFSNALGTLTYSPVYSPAANTENIDYELVGKLKGYRANITCKLFNVDDDDYESFVRFFRDINEQINRGVQVSFDIEPRFDSSDVENIEEKCLLTSNIEMRDVSNFECAQTIDLEFVGIYLKSGLPTTYSAETYDNIIDESGNLIVDESGNYIVY
jgi:hypothetical protein